ncbi:NAD(P)/FAD-dependent oxidoreductase [Chitinophaga sp. GCM10012297]|uniref:NAD(P)/FAD-dependent oxidoreductase n=1 Tax=Chitinophaga chungangae TaxID=2821488 RepID=A0ABS3Y986_9BACT|nr:NAD(P)/FAD-dependent oxidoreductase [Chitinophaga chungangae]MBO9151245.1 NAD(P)/FAD-dependent oxidoreductase [Chitinophaga chungangae]
MNTTAYEAAIVGGSSAGLAAALTLGRFGRRTIVFDTGAPRNKPAAHAHNFFTRDGEPPAELLRIAREQLQPYPSVELQQLSIATAEKTTHGFLLTALSGERFETRKIIIATGVKDILPAIEGLQELWGESIFHCPYCHGWEIKGEPVAIIANGDNAWHFAQIVSQLNKDITFLTNGPSALSSEQTGKLQRKGFSTIEIPIASVQKEKENGGIRITFADGSSIHKTAAYYRGETLQYHNEIAKQLGCELSGMGSVVVNFMYETTVPGVFAAGDVSHDRLHQVSMAAAGGHAAAGSCNGQLCAEDFEKDI